MNGLLKECGFKPQSSFYAMFAAGISLTTLVLLRIYRLHHWYDWVHYIPLLSVVSIIQP